MLSLILAQSIIEGLPEPIRHEGMAEPHQPREFRQQHFRRGTMPEQAHPPFQRQRPVDFGIGRAGGQPAYTLSPSFFGTPGIVLPEVGFQIV